MSHVALSLRHYSGETAIHCHDHHQLVLPHRGRMEIDVEGRGAVVANETGIFIVAGSVHTFYAAKNTEFIIVDAPLGLPAAERALPSSLLDNSFQVGLAAQGLIDNLIATLGTFGTLSAEARYAWSVLLFESLAQARERPLDPDGLIIRRAMVFMRAQLSNLVRVQDIAVAAGVSQSNLHALFRKHLQVSPHALLIEMRIRAACRLLRSTNLSVAEIAVRTGHSDQSALTRRLRLARGTTPAALRRYSRNEFA